MVGLLAYKRDLLLALALAATGMALFGTAVLLASHGVLSFRTVFEWACTHAS